MSRRFWFVLAALLGEIDARGNASAAAAVVL